VAPRKSIENVKKSENNFLLPPIVSLRAIVSFPHPVPEKKVILRNNIFTLFSLLLLVRSEPWFRHYYRSIHKTPFRTGLVLYLKMEAAGAPEMSLMVHIIVMS
jgi:hypothetical protein